METEIVAGTSMKITCSRDELGEAGSLPSGLDAGVQVLSGVLLRAEGDGWSSPTDMEISARDPAAEEETAGSSSPASSSDLARYSRPEVVLEHPR